MLKDFIGLIRSVKFYLYLLFLDIAFYPNLIRLSKVRVFLFLFIIACFCCLVTNSNFILLLNAVSIIIISFSIQSEVTLL